MGASRSILGVDLLFPSNHLTTGLSDLIVHMHTSMEVGNESLFSRP